MEIKFNSGKKEDALEFIQNLKKGDNLAIISHNDLDGLVSAKILEKISSPKLTELVSYDQISGLVSSLKKSKINKIIFSDLSLDFPGSLSKFESLAEVLIIDHHQFKNDLSSSRTTFLNSQGYCASYICNSIFSECTDLKNLEWLVALASLSDWLYLKNTGWIKKVFEKEKEKFDPQDVQKGKFWESVLIISDALIYFKDNPKKAYELIDSEKFDLSKISPYVQKVRRDLEYNLTSFEKEKEQIPGGFFYEMKSEYDLNSRFASLVSGETPDKTYIISTKNNNLYRISARRSDGKRDMSELVKYLTLDLALTNAGGHIAAAGCNVLKVDYALFKEKLKRVPEEMFVLKK